MGMKRAWASLLVAAAVAAGFGFGAAAAPATPQAQPPVRLRIVGGLGKLSQYTRHEVPFWTEQFPRASGARASAEIAPFDQIGLAGGEMLRLIQIGAVPFEIG